MEDISSQSMSEAEVYWNCDSPTPTAWQRHQIPWSNESRRQENREDVRIKPLVHKKVKTTLFEVDMKSFDTARKLIRELGKQNYDVNNSLDSIFERSGNGEQLASVETNEAKQSCEDDIWADDYISDECLLQNMSDVYKTKPSVSTSTPLRPPTKPKEKLQSSKQITKSHEELDFSTPEDCIEFFMSGETQKKRGSPVLICKTPKRKLEVTNVSIPEEILSQLIMEDSWTEACSKPSNSTKSAAEIKKTECGNCIFKPKATKTFKPVSVCVNPSTNKRPENVPRHNIQTVAGVKKHKQYQFVSKPSNVLKVSNMPKPFQKSMVPDSHSEISNNKLPSNANNENLFSDDDEELLLQAVMLTESQKSQQTLPPQIQTKQFVKKCSASEIERKKQEALKRRFQRSKK